MEGTSPGTFVKNTPDLHGSAQRSRQRNTEDHGRKTEHEIPGHRMQCKVPEVKSFVEGAITNRIRQVFEGICCSKYVMII